MKGGGESRLVFKGGGSYLVQNVHQVYPSSAIRKNKPIFYLKYYVFSFTVLGVFYDQSSKNLNSSANIQLFFISKYEMSYMKWLCEI